MKTKQLPYYKLIFIILSLLIFNSSAIAEGSKDIYIGTNETHLYLCSDSISHCAGTGGDRSLFATYVCDSLERLCFHINSTNEIVYLGFNPDAGFGDNIVVYRIKDAFGNIVKTQEAVPTSGGPGFISSINEARIGPIQIAGSPGYDAIVYTPPGLGYYYIEFSRVLGSSPTTPSPGGFNIELFDITIENSVTSIVEEGRLFSHSWQLYETNLCSANLFLYSNDSLTTSFEMNNLDGGVWVTYANQYGCANTGNFSQDRKSLFHYLDPIPQFRIFLNEPDANVFPAATTLGTIIPPVTTQSDCDGTIDFNVAVSNNGTVELNLSFPPPYEPRIITQSVVAGTNIIEWDGLDGNTSAVPVPNNTSVTYTCSYIIGLCNVPLYDVESNNSGFNIEIASPAGLTALTYWDDSNIPGGTTNLVGCSSSGNPWSGCHAWPDGDYNLMNTWSYVSSSTTAPMMIIQQRNPESLVFVQQPPQYYSPGNTSVPFSVVADANTDSYFWNYTGSDVTITQVNPGDNFITVDFGPSATSGDLEVYGTNTNCPNPSPTSLLPITIGPPQTAIADFSGTPTSGETPLLVNFTDLSTGSIDSWLWGFGDGNTSTNQNPINTYNTIGTFTVSLTVTDINGSDSETKTDYITVTAPVIIPQFDADVTSGEVPLIVSFTDQSIGNNISWLWDFGDENSSTDQNPIHIYNDPGTYTVRLTISDSYSSQTEIKTDYITVSIPLLIAEFEGTPTTGNIPFDVSFTDLSTGNNLSWLWDFGDGNTSAEQNPIHTYDGIGVFTVSLTITDAYGSTTETKSDYITSSPPILTAEFTGDPVSGDSPLEVVFSDISVGSPTSWLWEFGDGSTSTEEDPIHVYMDEGEYTVSLTITDQYGSDIETKNNYITVAVIVANFDAVPTSGNVPLIVTFGDLSTGDIDSWYWDFGDGETSSFQLPVHTYNLAGDYNVSLIVLGPAGSDTLLKENYINVTVPAPIADFSASPTIGDAPLLVTFTDLSTGEIDSWEWDFGDDNTSSEQNPIHEYLSPGNFTVSLIVEGIGGSNKIIMEDYILIPVGTINYTNEAFIVFPNPATEKLNIVFPNEDIRNVVLRNMKGKVVLEQNTIEQELQLSIDKIPNGIYLLSIESNGEISKTLKVIKR